jgi:hypothetical protein
MMFVSTSPIRAIVFFTCLLAAPNIVESETTDGFGSLTRNLAEDVSSAVGRKSLWFYRYFSTTLSRNKVVGILDCDYDDPNLINFCPPPVNPMYDGSISRSGGDPKKCLDDPSAPGCGSVPAPPTECQDDPVKVSCIEYFGGMVPTQCFDSPSEENCTRYPPEICKKVPNSDVCLDYFEGWGDATPPVDCIQDYENEDCAGFYGKMPPLPLLEDSSLAEQHIRGDAGGVRNNGLPPTSCVDDPLCISLFGETDQNQFTSDVPSGSTTAPIATTEPTRDDCYGNMVDGRFCTSEMPSISEEPTSAPVEGGEIPPGNTTFAPTAAPFWVSKVPSEEGYCPINASKIDPTDVFPRFMPIVVQSASRSQVEFDVNQYWKQVQPIGWVATVYTPPEGTTRICDLGHGKAWGFTGTYTAACFNGTATVQLYAFDGDLDGIFDEASTVIPPAECGDFSNVGHTVGYIYEIPCDCGSGRTGGGLQTPSPQFGGQGDAERAAGSPEFAGAGGATRKPTTSPNLAGDGTASRQPSETVSPDLIGSGVASKMPSETVAPDLSGRGIA